MSMEFTTEYQFGIILGLFVTIYWVGICITIFFTDAEVRKEVYILGGGLLLMVVLIYMDETRWIDYFLDFLPGGSRWR